MSGLDSRFEFLAASLSTFARIGDFDNLIGLYNAELLSGDAFGLGMYDRLLLENVPEGETCFSGEVEK